MFKVLNKSETQLFDTSATTTDDNSRTGGADFEVNLVGFAIDQDIGNSRIAKGLFDKLADLVVFLSQDAITVYISVPTGKVGLGDAEA